MTRLKRYCPAGLPVHIIQRGNNRTACFLSEEDRAAYAHLLGQASNIHDSHIHAWVLMSNHVHLLITPNHDRAASKMMQHLGREYVRYFNRKHSRSGTLWEGRFRSCLVQEESYFLTCQRYIELNPVRASIVDDPGKYHWSSYQSNALGKMSSLRTPHQIYLALGKTEDERLRVYRGLFSEIIDSQVVNSIRTATNKGLVLGSEAFKDRIEKISCQRTRLLKRGRKPTVPV